MPRKIDNSKNPGAEVKFIGKWVNQHGSFLEIYMYVEGKISGTFKTGVGAHDPDEEFIISGMANGNLISFTVNFQQHGCITSWVGHLTCDEDEEKLDTMWHLTRALPKSSEQESLWTGVWTGADTFTRFDDDKRNLEEFVRPRVIPSYPCVAI